MVGERSSRSHSNLLRIVPLALANFADLAAVSGEAVPSEMRAIVDAANQQETREQAEELRTAADQFLEPSGQEPLRRAAGNCEQMADYAEALPDGKLTPPAE
jgi:hypothetical protein